MAYMVFNRMSSSPCTGLRKEYRHPYETLLCNKCLTNNATKVLSVLCNVTHAHAACHVGNGRWEDGERVEKDVEVTDRWELHQADEVGV